MHDIKTIKADPDAFKAALARRGDDTDVDALIAMDERRVANTVAMNEAQAKQKQVSGRIGKAKAAGDEAAARAGGKRGGGAALGAPAMTAAFLPASRGSA